MKAFVALALPAFMIASPALAEVGGTASTAQAITLGAEFLKGSLEFDGDKDWYKFKLTAGTDYAVGAYSGEDPAAFRLRNPSGTVVLQSETYSDEYIGFEYRAPKDGTYYLEFQEKEASALPQSYIFKVSRDCRAATTTKCTIAVGQSIDSHGVYGNDGDYYKAVLDRAKTYTASILMPYCPDIGIYIYNSNNRKLTEAYPKENPNGGCVASIAGWKPPASGTYHIVVWTNYEPSAYNLKLSTP
jgi:hypothetical protein